MKQPVQFFTWKPFFVFLFLSLISLAMWGQETGSGGSESSTTTTTKSTNVSISANDGAGEWYTSPWVWVVGAAVFILLLVALLSNRGKETVTSDRVVSKTVERDRRTDV